MAVTREHPHAAGVSHISARLCLVEVEASLIRIVIETGVEGAGGVESDAELGEY